MFTYASEQPASAERRLASARRTSSLLRSYGEPLITTSKPARWSRVAATGPPSCQRSSQIASATSHPCTRTMHGASPGTKWRYSSKTP